MNKRTRTTTTSNRGSKKPRHTAPLILKYGKFWNGTTSDPEIITVLVKRRDFASHYDVTTSRLNLVQEVWEHEIIPFFSVKELAMLRPTCRWCDEQWQEFLKRNTFRVPEQVPTMKEAMRVSFNLSKQKVYSKEKPLVVVLSEGEHVVEESWTDSDGDVHENTLDTTCSNVSFVGQGKDKTTVHGGFGLSNKKNVTVKSLTLTNLNGFGLYVQGEEASVKITSVSVKRCKRVGLCVLSGGSAKVTECEFSENGGTGMYMSQGSKGIITDCTFHHNGGSGMYAQDECTLVELRGEKTEIHHNKAFALIALHNATMNIFIPSRPITALIHDNKVRNLVAFNVGKIQSQLSSLSLELTVIYPVPHYM